jgi:microcystin-dependent protein
LLLQEYLFLQIKGNRYQDTLKDAVVGDFKWSVRNSDFSGWVLCDGRSLNRVTYSQLYEVIGTTFGSSSGTTFKVPDCRGKVAGAAGTGSGLTARSLGDVDGSETHTLTVPEMPSHSHTTNANGGQNGFGLVTANGYNTVVDTDYSLGELNVWTTPYALTVNNTGGGNAFSVMQPTIFLGNVFIYTGVLEPDEPMVYTEGPDDTEYKN